ncbi:MAG: serine hydrolase, partial [Pseudomonadota bacterium]
MMKWKTIAGLGLVLITAGSHAQHHELDAEASDPRKMGWMVGSPPPPDKIIAPPASNFMSFPKLRWTFCHLREMQATRRVSRGVGPASTLSESPDPAIDDLRFTPLGGETDMTWRESLNANYTDGILIMHRGKIIYEYYSGCLDAEGRHGAMSVTKSFVGTVAEILIAEGVIDEKALVTQYVPELADSAFG